MKKCQQENCDKYAHFNIANEKIAIYCSKHKKIDMIDICHKKCKEENCNKHPNFNLLNEKIGIYCKEHKKVDMIDIKSKKCLEENCTKQPIFNLLNEKIGIYCKEHKKVNMIDIKSKKCLEENCNKQPFFNLSNEKNGKYCKKHKKDDMIDVINKKCLEEKCKKIPVFNLLNEKDGIYCKEHKKENMVNIRDKKCLEENCNKIPNFNLTNEKNGIYCKEHKKVGMVDVKNNKCLVENCDTQANYKKYKGYCFRCFIDKFPDVKISRNYKVKENHMTDFIKEQFKDEKIVFNKTIYGGSSRRRPDVYIDKITHVIIGECDENQHDIYDDENIRLIELLKDIGEKPVVFIRFNPDSYINENSKKIPSSFKLDKTTGNVIIRDSKEWSNRLNVLKETIEKYLVKIPSKEVTYEYLFYNYQI